MNYENSFNGMIFQKDLFLNNCLKKDNIQTVYIIQSQF